jgi:4-amino-4-deoxy-L-arabinose transferase-like glycosyltransferase
VRAPRKEPLVSRALNTLAVVGILLFALALRVPHLDWGFPEVHEEATPVREAIQFWGTPGSGIDLNPHFFKYPTFTFYLNFILQSAWYFGLSLANQVESLNEFRQLLGEQLTRAVLLGRWLQVFLGALAVLPALWLGRILGGRVGGWCAALLVAVLPMAVVESQQVTPDVALMVASALGLVTATRLAEGGKRSHYLWTGLWVGLAAAAKYPGALLVAALVVAHALRVRKGGEGPAGILLSGLLWQSLLIAGVVFVAASPYVVLDLSTAVADIGFERRHMALGHLGREDGRAFTYYLLDVFPRGLTPLVAVFSLLGLGGLLARRDLRARALPGLAFAAVWLVVLGSWKMGAPRYVLPLVPLVAVWAGAGADLVRQRLGGGRGRERIVAAGMVLALLVWPLAESARAVAFRGRVDSRRAADEWIEAHVPEGSSILAERYGPEPSPERFLVLYLPFHGVTPHVYDLAYLPQLYATFDYVVLSSGVSARYLARPREYSLQTAFYAALNASFDEMASFSPGLYVGPEVRVLRRRQDRTIPDVSTLPPSIFRSQPGNTALAEHLAALGTVLVRQDRGDLGFPLLQTAVDLAPESAKTWGNLGSMRLERGRVEEALIAFRRARDLEPENAEIWFNLGILFTRMAEPRQAADAYEKALSLRPEMEEAYIGLARVLIEDDRFARARSVLEQFVLRFPRSPRRQAAEEVLGTLRQMGPGRP